MKRESEFAAFTAAMRERAEAGEVAYGDESFRSKPLDLVAMIQEELVDVANWAWILHSRLAVVARRLQAAEPG